MFNIQLSKNPITQVSYFRKQKPLCQKQLCLRKSEKKFQKREIRHEGYGMRNIASKKFRDNLKGRPWNTDIAM